MMVCLSNWYLQPYREMQLYAKKYGKAGLDVFICQNRSMYRVYSLCFDKWYEYSCLLFFPDMILMQAFVGPNPNALMLSYLKHAISSQVI